MRKTSFIFFFFLFGIGNVYSQDTIYLVNHTLLVAKITDVNVGDISFKMFNNPDGPSYHKKTSDILRIKYSNGMIEFYEESETMSDLNSTERGERATLLLKTGKTIDCEIFEVCGLSIIYKERGIDENVVVLLKEVVDRIVRPDSSFSTFTSSGREEKHDKPVKVVIVVAEKKVDPVPVVKTEDPVTPPTTAPSKTKKTLKGECLLLDSDGNPIKTKDVLVDMKNQTVSYVDQNNVLVTKPFAINGKAGIRSISFKRKNNNSSSLDLAGEFEFSDLDQE